MLLLQSHTVRVTHWINAACVGLLLISGLAIVLAHPRFYWGESGFFDESAALQLPLTANLDHTSWGRNLHFLAAWVLVINGILYAIHGLRSGHIRRNLLPGRNDFTVRALWADTVRSLTHPAQASQGKPEYHTVQRLLYLGVMFLALPAMLMTGLAMSPGVSAALWWLPDLLGGRQTARTLHFLLTMLLATFIVVHVVQVVRARDTNRIRTSMPAHASDVERTSIPTVISRRRWLSGAGATAVLAALTVTRRQLPVQAGGLFGLSDGLTFTAHRILLRNQPLAREFDASEITARFPAINTVNPEDETYQRLRAGGFVDWRLPITGLVTSPTEFSLAELKAMPARTQITQHACEQGWSAIAQWTGVPLSLVLDHVRMRAMAKFVVFRCVDGWWDSLDLFDALHPQTLLAYGMNGEDLPVRHGAPVRLRVERQLGYKSLKYVSSIEIVESLEAIGEGRGSGAAEAGYNWYAGI